MPVQASPPFSAALQSALSSPGILSGTSEESLLKVKFNSEFIISFLFMRENLYNDISIAILYDVPIVPNIVHTQKTSVEVVLSFCVSHTIIAC